MAFLPVFNKFLCSLFQTNDFSCIVFAEFFFSFIQEGMLFLIVGAVYSPAWTEGSVVQLRSHRVRFVSHGTRQVSIYFANPSNFHRLYSDGCGKVVFLHLPVCPRGGVPSQVTCSYLWAGLSQETKGYSLGGTPPLGRTRGYLIGSTKG